MALPTYAIPYGLRDVKLKPFPATGETPLGTAVDLPASRIFSFAENEDFEELRGDDTVVATHGNGPTVNWSLEAGGISLDAYKVIAGGTVTTSGVTPNEKKMYSKLGTDSRPYFQAEGQVISDNGGDLHGIVYKAKAEGEIGGQFEDATFFLTGASGRGLPRISDSKVYDFVQNETAAAIV
jgi:hypothetical protein